MNEASNTRSICEKWYEKLGFPAEYNEEFRAALSKYEIPADLTIEKYNLGEKDGKRNLLSFLYFCEALSEMYREKGIDEKILLDTLSDIVIWNNTWSSLKGELYLGEIGWLQAHMRMRLFRLGSLQFCMGKTDFDCPALGLKPGMKVMEIHIPAGTDLSPDACERSFSLAKEFFAAYYPDFPYDFYTCHSWLLAPELKKLLRPDSNILRFQERFTMLEDESEKDDAALRYVFGWNTNRSTLKDEACASGFAARLKQYALDGGVLHVSGGVIAKNAPVIV